MKIIKYVFLLLLLAFIAVTVFIATQEGKYNITKERTIRVPKAILFNYINDYRNWENIGILSKVDTAAVYSYSENTVGRGAVAKWKIDDTTGEVKTLKVIEGDSIVQTAIINGQPSAIRWGFKSLGNSTKVSVHIKSELSFMEKANAVLRGGVSEKLEASLNKGLLNLDDFLVHELTTYKVKVHGVVNKAATFYLGTSGSSTINGMNRKMNEILPKLMEFVKENKIVTNGSPFVLYKTFDTAKNSTSFTVCIPIKDEIFTMAGSDIEGGKLDQYVALKTTLTGDYSHLPKAWDAAHKAVRDQNLGENTAGKYIEVYSSNILHTKKPSQWVTDIFIPVGPVTATPAPEGDLPNATDVPPATITAPAGAARPASARTAPRPGTGRPALTGTGPARTPRATTPAPSTGTAQPATTPTP